MHLVPRLIDNAEATETFRALHEFYVCDVHARSGPRFANMWDPNQIPEPEVIMHGIMVIFITRISRHTKYRVSQEECARLRESVPYVKVYRYNPKHLCPKLNGYGDNDQRKVWSSGGSTHCTCQLTILSMSILECGVILRQFSSRSL